jgi:hypothetical protein
MEVETTLTVRELYTLFTRIGAGEGGLNKWFIDSDGNPGLEKTNWVRKRRDEEKPSLP